MYGGNQAIVLRETVYDCITMSTRYEMLSCDVGSRFHMARTQSGLLEISAKRNVNNHHNTTLDSV